MKNYAVCITIPTTSGRVKSKTFYPGNVFPVLNFSKEYFVRGLSMDNKKGLKKVSRKHSHLLKTSKIINKSQLINSFIVIAMKQYTINDYDESNRDKLQKMINNNKIFILENYILLTECISEQLLNNNNLYRNHLYMINCEDVSNRIDEIQKMIKFDINLTPSKKRIKNI